MAAALASGTTKLLNCAREPEIVELCSFLRSMGAKISGERTGTITVDGVEKLFPTDHVTAGDRICAGTYLAAAAAAGGEIDRIYRNVPVFFSHGVNIFPEPPRVQVLGLLVRRK